MVNQTNHELPAWFLRPLLAVDPACAVPPVGARVGSADRETAAVGADSRGHPYRAVDSPVLPGAGASAQGPRGTGASLRGQGGLRHADDARAAGPLGHRRGAAADLRLGAEERGAERVGLLTRLRRVLRHTVAPAHACSVDPQHPPRPVGGSPLPRLDGHRGPREAGREGKDAPAAQAQAGTAEQG